MYNQLCDMPRQERLHFKNIIGQPVPCAFNKQATKVVDDSKVIARL